MKAERHALEVLHNLQAAHRCVREAQSAAAPVVELADAWGELDALALRLAAAAERVHRVGSAGLRIDPAHSGIGCQHCTLPESHGDRRGGVH